jgi:hypothetical protein
MKIRDDEWFGGDEFKNVAIGPLQRTLTTQHPLFQFPQIGGCAGGEVRSEVIFTVQKVPNFSDRVKVTLDVKYFEGTSCNTQDLQVSMRFTKIVKRGQILDWKPSVSDSEGGVYFTLKLAAS